LLAQRTGDGHVRVYVALRVPESWRNTCSFDLSSPAQTRQGLLALFSDWAPELRDLLHRCEDAFVARPLFTFSPEQSWRTHPAITLAGDAAHVMPPFTGRGMNCAMLDALKLAEHLTSDHFHDLPSALGAYEAEMHQRMATAISEATGAQNLMIAPDAPRELAALLAQRKASGA
jgi:2-polyprenyl-6-methoxyphenol hydroxylase-like FAD-dependent oxidoreductase